MKRLKNTIAVVGRYVWQHGQLFAFLLIFGTFVWLFDQFEDEVVARQNENCVLFERIRNDNIKGLQSAYDYLGGLTTDQTKEPLNQLILLRLPTIEEDAKRKEVPSYCDDKSWGLPEPPPKIPERPQEVEALYQDALKQLDGSPSGQGATGPRGDAGPRGDTGARGDTGDRGARGP